ncbi:MAG: spermidine synthase [Bacillota bacterium]
MRRALRFRFEEEHAPGLWLAYGLGAVLRQEKTPYQELSVVDTEAFGRALILDGVMQTTERDEFFYHEMMTHVPMLAHPCPRRVLVVGGGDGGVVREVLKHPTAQKVDLVEIDARVPASAREFLPFLARALDDPRVNQVVEDGAAFVARCDASYDVAIVDCTDPVGIPDFGDPPAPAAPDSGDPPATGEAPSREAPDGGDAGCARVHGAAGGPLREGPAASLFRPEFYASLARVLQPHGVFSCQVESPFYYPEVLVKAHRVVGRYFPLVRIYLGPVPTYPGGWWGYVVGSHGPDPSRPPEESRLGGIMTRYYTRETHRAAFALPRYLQEMLAAEEVAPSGGG